jgi:translation initiation factor IF-2
MEIEVSELIKKCFDLGMMVSINQRLEKDLIVLLAEEFGFTIEFQKEYQEDVLEDIDDKEDGEMINRSPVVTIMGHVDHGKTSLLDYIRKANVVAGEAGGITQHIGAYKVYLENGKQITFLDTPGHEAFTAMRARGGQAADIVVLVVAADDSVMPQTIEAINHALAANVPIIVAINKVDKPDSNPAKIKQQLADNGILIEEWGGKYQSVELSAKFGTNVDELLDKILLEAEVLELKANANRNARGVVLEAKLDRGKGVTATVLVQKGTLNVGDNFIAGLFSGRVKAMYDEREHKINKALPSTPLQVLGFDGMPQAGDMFIVLESERDIKEISLKRQQLKREQDFRQVRFVTLDDISSQIKQGKTVELKIILKGDTDGSVEALAESLQKQSTQEAKVIVIHKAIGQISESDVLLAEASNAIIIGFNVRPNLNARKLAEKNQVDIRMHNIIYNVIDEVKLALEGMLEPEISEEVTSTIEVRDVFKIPKVGNVAGCFVQDGKIARGNKVRLLRDGFVIFNGNLLSLKRHKDDVREVDAGYECGIGLENFNDIKVGDIIEGYKIVETKRKLSTT